jgi:ATP-dependent DNA helicase PIF1
MTQAQAFEILKSGQHVFLTGPPGSGKTYMLNRFIKYLKRKRKRVGVTASTGIAATHINGISIHSWSGLGVRRELKEPDMNKLLKNRRLKQRFERSHTLIIDEISMLHAWQLDLVNQIAQAFRQNLTPFGGLQIVMCGDLFQLPPVSRDGVAQYVSESTIWPQLDLQVCYLSEQHRHEDDILLSVLNEIRTNQVSDNVRKVLVSRLHQKLDVPEKPTKLYTHNTDVDSINSTELSRIKQPAKRYIMQSRGTKSLVESLKNGCLAPEELLLKVGAQVMFVKNNFESGFVNGTIGEVIDFDEGGLPIVKTLKGAEIVANPESWTIEENDKKQAEIRQIPLRLAWAITVHKSQGMSLEVAEINLAKSFVPGMGYVALSRVRSLDGMTLQGINELALQVDPQVLEIDQSLQEHSKRSLAQLSNGQLKKVKQRGNWFSNKQPKISNKQKTKVMIANKFSIAEITSKQGLTQGTIIKHIEELVNSGVSLDATYLLPPKSDLDKIIQAFDECGIQYLKPVHEHLSEQYSYDQLRLVRMWYKQQRRGEIN